MPKAMVDISSLAFGAARHARRSARPTHRPQSSLSSCAPRSEPRPDPQVPLERQRRAHGADLRHGGCSRPAPARSRSRGP
eukprot:2074028-Alexandrium_andersonii.AAC.1